tara:strand:+ start:1325 stop:2092 length:768 start_codon:yes stop_codon:yes gene_type:complete
MNNLLPAQSGLTVEGVFHRYTLTKDPTKDATVSITNKKVGSDEYIYNYVDDWNKIPGGTKVAYDAVPSLLGNLFGDGEIKVNGDGSLSDVTILYHFKYDPCDNPLTNPECPGFDDAMLKYLLDNNLIDSEPDVNDPFYDEWVQFQLDQKAEQEEEQELSEEELEEEPEEEISIEDMLSVATAAEQISNPEQQIAMMEQLSAAGMLDAYSKITIDGGVYEETIVLDGGEIKDNYRAFRNLSQDKLHDKIVRSQFKE